MGDVHNKSTRSRNMSAIKGKNTKPEIQIRKLLHSIGYRYRLHVKELPGKPDIVLSKYKVAIQINGCFWHKHECHLFKWPSTRTEFWKNKINKNAVNDKKNILSLQRQGWRVLIIWECALKGKKKIQVSFLIETIISFINSEDNWLEIVGA